MLHKWCILYGDFGELDKNATKKTFSDSQLVSNSDWEAFTLEGTLSNSTQEKTNSTLLVFLTASNDPSIVADLRWYFANSNTTDMTQGRNVDITGCSEGNFGCRYEQKIQIPTNLKKIFSALPLVQLMQQCSGVDLNYHILTALRDRMDESQAERAKEFADKQLRIGKKLGDVSLQRKAHVGSEDERELTTSDLHWILPYFQETISGC
jgi:hypothetical protein